MKLAEMEEIAKKRQQPKAPEVEEELAARYEAMDLQDRAYNILLDLGLIEEHN